MYLFETVAWSDALPAKLFGEELLNFFGLAIPRFGIGQRRELYSDIRFLFCSSCI